MLHNLQKKLVNFLVKINIIYAEPKGIIYAVPKGLISQFSLL